jgi:selenocysteine-specific elongation factor
LTVFDTDWLKEEKERGVSIALGYAYHPLPNNDVLGFVDVPGHERLIHTMLAGAAGIDFFLLIVAADDGIMPQTLEHLEILELLGIERGAIALTKIDRVEPARAEAVRTQIEALRARARLPAVPIFLVSSLTGDGIDALRRHLCEAAVHLPKRRDGGLFRLAVDRSFTLRGAGTVVTGTVFAGAAQVGAELTVVPSGKRVRVRGLHVQDRPAEAGHAAQRILSLLGQSPLDTLWVRDLARALDREECSLRQLMRKMSAQGMPYQIVRDLFFVPEAMDRLIEIIRELAAENEGVRAAAFRDRTGLGRK